MGNIQFTENGILFTANGIAMDPDCCCVPCFRTCTDWHDKPQPDAIVSVSGECSATCPDAAGTYSDAYHYSLCGVVWNPSSEMRLTVFYEEDPNRWLVYIYDSSYGVNIFEGYLPCSAITCDPETGRLNGTFDIPGVNYLFDCSGCTATITLGP